MRIRTSFPYETTHEDLRVPLPDGTKLYARSGARSPTNPYRPCSNTCPTG